MSTNVKTEVMEMDFIKELFSGKKLYLTSSIEEPITRITIHRKPGLLSNSEVLTLSDAWHPMVIHCGIYVYHGNVNSWGGITDVSNNWQGKFSLTPIAPMYEIMTKDGWKEIEPALQKAIGKVLPVGYSRITTRERCVEVSTLINIQP